MPNTEMRSGACDRLFVTSASYDWKSNAWPTTCDNSHLRASHASSFLSALGPCFLTSIPACVHFNGRLERLPFALARGRRSNTLSDRMIHRSGDSTCADHALIRVSSMAMHVLTCSMVRMFALRSSVGLLARYD